MFSALALLTPPLLAATPLDRDPALRAENAVEYGVDPAPLTLHLSDGGLTPAPDAASWGEDWSARWTLSGSSEAWLSTRSRFAMSDTGFDGDHSGFGVDIELRQPGQAAMPDGIAFVVGYEADRLILDPSANRAAMLTRSRTEISAADGYAGLAMRIGDSASLTAGYIRQSRSFRVGTTEWESEDQFAGFAYHWSW